MEKSYVSFLNDYANEIGETIGLSIDKINQIEKDFNVNLPLAYKQFLFSFGRKSGFLLNGYYIEYPELIHNKGDVFHELNFDDRKTQIEKPEIKDSYFFFAQWQGYNFFFFDCSLKEDNPIVFLFDTNKIIKYKDSFTEFLRDEGLKPLLDNLS
ncbi:SMI1/KNR4 family protein [Aquimarina mytili]|uniref:SMI1/KNR4 family protein n=1 Tax=Aquimarina mytili TaxID=874423 RepID=A0A937DCT0_9FLAO|nr:SMI1/KNR4 family protein [Aquimarina mytili]MBL0685271.1 SMI1/KNR4 family protein [Aquimarina mytili]